MPTKLSFHHFHEGNDKDREVRGKSPYATEAKIVDLETGEVLDSEMAYCSPNDTPRRKYGREVAGGRLLKRARLSGMEKPINVQ